MIIQHITDFLENRFPLSLQESYDNCGLTYGHKNTALKGVLISLDVTEALKMCSFPRFPVPHKEDKL